MKDVDSFRFRAFLEHPDALLSPVKAAMEVGYSETTAKIKSYNWRKDNLPVLFEKMRATLQGLAVTPDWVKNEVKILADTTMSDFTEFVEDANGNQHAVLLPAEQINPEKWRAAIKEVEFDTIMSGGGQLRSRVCKIKLYDRQSALVELGNLLGMKNEKLLLANAPQMTEKSEEEKVMEFMTVDELEAIAAIQERAAARMRKTASNRRDADAIPGTTSERSGHDSSAPKRRPTPGNRKAAALPPSASEYDDE